MDIAVSRKETRYLPSGATDVLMSDVFDIYPVFADDGLGISDVEVITDSKTELLDRAMWAAVKQRGLDPLSLTDGNQYEECIMGDVSVVTLMAQINASVAAVGTGVSVEFSTAVSNGRTYMSATVRLSS